MHRCPARSRAKWTIGAWLVAAACERRIAPSPRSATTAGASAPSVARTVVSRPDGGATRLAVGERRASACPAVEQSDRARDAPGDDEISPNWAAPPRGMIAQCAPRSAEFRAARAGFDALERTMDALEAGQDPTAAKNALEALLSHPCFALGSVDDLPIGRSAHSLRSWWMDGGASWVESLLVAPQSSSGSTRQTLWFAPSELRSLVLEEHRDSALAPVLCAANDEACGRESAPFVLRYQRLLAGHDAVERVVALDHDDPPRRSSEDWHEYCARMTAAARPSLRYAAFRQCATVHLQERGTRLPLGRFRNPTGWLVVEGRRGHHAYCDAVTAFHLATGSLYRAKRCDGMHFVRAFNQRDAGADTGVDPIVVTAARVDVQTIRDVALALLLAPHLTADARESIGLEAPTGVRIEHDSAARASFNGFVMSGRFSSGQTQLRWRWFSNGCLRVAGTLRWPESDDAGADVAAHLLAVSEASLDDNDSPEAPLPRWIGEELSHVDEPATSGVERELAAYFREAQEPVRQALRERVALP